MGLDILIYTMPRDMHAWAAKWALESIGHSVHLYYVSDFPSSARTTIHIGAHAHMSNVGADASFENKRFDVVWNRRRGPVSPSKAICNFDAEFIRAESLAFVQALRSLPSCNV